MFTNELSAALHVLHPLSKAYQAILEDDNFSLQKTIRKDDMLLMPGMDTDRLIYMPRGCCKIYWLDNDNEEHPFMYLGNGDFIILPDTVCIGQRNEDLYIRMLTDSDIWILQGKQMMDVYAAHPEASVHKALISKKLVNLRDQHVLMLMRKECDRYAYFVKVFQYVYKMQLTEKELCRFMNICRRTLSKGKTNWLLKDRKRR